MPRPTFGSRVRAVQNRLARDARTDLREASRLVTESVANNGVERQRLLQVVKSVAAAVAGWLVASYALGLAHPYVAPLIAMLMVQPTIVRSVFKGMQQVVAIATGMLAALLVVHLIPEISVALAAALLISFLIGTWKRLGDQGMYAPIVALTMIALHSATGSYFSQRLLETLIGVGIGAAINLVVKPPHYLDLAKYSAAATVAEVADIMRSIAAGIRAGWGAEDARTWQTRADRLEGQVAQSLDDVGWARESILLNPKRWWAETKRPRATYRPVIVAVGRTAEPLEHLARVLVLCADDERSIGRPEQDFLDSFAGILEEVAEAVADWARADTPMQAPSVTDAFEDDLMSRARHRGSELAERIRELPRDQVSAAGALLIAVEQVLDALPRLPTVAR